MTPLGKVTDEASHLSTRAIRQLPELGRAWIAFTPRRWKAFGGLWADLSTGALRQELSPRSAAFIVPRIGGDLGELDDLFYLPPVTTALRSQRDRLAAGLVEGGTPVLAHCLVGEVCEVEGVRTVVDLSQPLVDGKLGLLTRVDPSALALWPLIPGLADHPDIWDEGLEQLALGGVKLVLPLVVEISPRLRRRLAEGREDHIFDALFHGEPSSEISFARRAHRLGLDTLPDRPECGFSARQVSNRVLAGQLALAAELWLRLGRSVVAGQALLRAARGAEQSQQDLAALARERNLKVLTWLDARSISVIQELVGHGRSHLVDELRQEYLGEAPTSGYGDEDDEEGAVEDGDVEDGDLDWDDDDDEPDD